MHCYLNLSFVCGMLVGGGLLAAGMTLGGASGNQATPPKPPNAPPPAQAHETIRTRQIEILDEVGTAVLVIGSNDEGGSISIRDRFGKTVLLASAAKPGGALVINGADGTSAFSAGANESGGTASIRNTAGNAVIDLSAERGGAHVTLSDVNGKPMADLHSRERTGGTITTFNAAGDYAMQVFTDVAGGGVLETYRAKSGGVTAPLVTIGSTIGGHGQITTYAGVDRPLVSLTASAEHEGQIYTYSAREPNALSPIPAGAAGGDRERGKGQGVQPLIALGTRPPPLGGPSLRIFNEFGEAAVTLEPTATGQGEIGVWRRDGTGKTMTP